MSHLRLELEMKAMPEFGRSEWAVRVGGSILSRGRQLVDP